MTLFQVTLKTIFSNNYVYNTVFFSTAIIEKVQCNITIYPASSFITFPPFPSFGIFFSIFPNSYYISGVNKSSKS